MNRRFEISYNGYAFYGDSDGENVHYVGTWEDVAPFFFLEEVDGADLMIVDRNFNTCYYRGGWC